VNTHEGNKGKQEMPDEILSRDEVLAILSRAARDGSISAAIALERALRAREREQSEIDDVLDRILGGEGEGAGPYPSASHTAE
jgi:hypothetical protein